MQGKTACHGFVANISGESILLVGFHGQSVGTYLTPPGRTIQ